jgi:hypothetical protein
MKTFKKSQSALEFLMTYGWAILVVLAAIAALSYFGVLSPDKFASPKCVSQTGMTCAGLPILTSDSIAFTIDNEMGNDISFSKADVSAITFNIPGHTLDCGSALYVCPRGTQIADNTCVNFAGGPDPLPISDSSGVTIVLGPTCTYDGAALAEGKMYKADVTIPYDNGANGLTENKVITIQGRY